MEIIDQTWITAPDGTEWLVELTPDPDVTPDDYDCYDAADVAAWRADEWGYVIVRVSRGGAEASLAGVEYGEIAGRYVGLKEIVSDPYMSVVKDGEERSFTLVESLIEQAMGEVR